eukprot:CAMPEP_0197519532 /NCGR_PEP_ID=MMETSP1318-20131121/4799_1 /TAXON_ID=552666 /ORGANISM="Partenskyella glossopodia, Strain RCC365" /LENGTH=71 /DNA_ID=CAMNT_0043070557 /DNA_START=51 /DNA_END=263 /DNA_ORIENTATION=+
MAAAAASEDAGATEGNADESSGLIDVETDVILWTAGAKPVEVSGIKIPGNQNRNSVTIDPTLKIQGRTQEF